jgi:amino acid adenylation domain-containing protein
MKPTDRLTRLTDLPTALRSLRAQAPSQEDAGHPEAPGAVFPTSFPQQLLWILDQLEPGRPVHHLAAAVRLKGQLRVAALERSFDRIVERHDVLRATFVERDGRPVQRIAPSLRTPLPVTDLGGLPASQRDAAARRLIAEQARRPFDLARGPLLRAGLFRTTDDEHLLAVTMHHIVSDGWSLQLLFEELAAWYASFVTGRPSPLGELPIQYADYAQWQREWLTGDALAEHLAYWKRQLAGAPAVLELLTDQPRPPEQGFAGARESVWLDADLTAALRALGHGEDATLYMVLLAAFQALLGRYSGQEDVVVGSPVANRTHEETERLIGFFANLLVLRTDLSGDPTFRELLRRIREVALEAYAHQEVPFERLVEELQPERSLRHTPLFQVLLILLNHPREAVRLPGLELTFVEIDPGTAEFDLTLYAWEDGNETELTLEYKTELFDAATAARILSHLERLLRGAAANPDRRLSSVSLLGDEERRQLVEDWNATAADYTEVRRIHELFEAQAARTPGAPAVAYRDEQLTFGELNARANRLARHLRRLGVDSETLVGVCLERSPELVVALLAILKAGGAYVPLDPNYPQERLSYMLRDARIPVLVTERRLAGRVQADAAPNGLELMCLDEASVAHEDASDVAVSAPADALAYVIYTSGSTGQPKGVLGLHHGAVNRFAWMWRAFPFEPDEVCCAKTSLNFVDSVWELWGPLLQGVRVVLVPDEALADPEQLIRTLAAHRVTRIVLVPSLLRALLDAGGDLAGALPALRYWVTSGEALAPDLVERFGAALPGAALINLYGSSEVAADVTCYDVRRAGDHVSSVPIGRPIANTQIYLLDPHLNPVPVGVPGELCVGGAGLARGYLNRPDLTAEKFIPNPFAADAWSRLYRTGDRARYLPDGNIEYLGRLDHQVKVRGFRIELGEVEAALERHPAVRAAVVVAQDVGADDVRLIAYAVPASETPPPRELRDALKQELPDYMVPAAFVLLDALPLTPNGKVDRKALPEPDWSRPERQEVFVAPRTPTEEALAGIWSSVLRVERVSVHDNFFELGGHSLLATQVLARVRQAFRLNLQARNLFDAPTAAKFAAKVEAARASGAEYAAPALVPRAREMSRAAAAAGPAFAHDHLGDDERRSAVIRQIAEGYARRLLAELNQLSSSELNALLEGLAPEGGPGE